MEWVAALNGLRDGNLAIQAGQCGSICGTERPLSSAEEQETKAHVEGKCMKVQYTMISAS